MIHRVVFGSIERFIGILIEHFAGAFPTWLAPEQVRVIPIAEAHQAYAREVAQTLEAAGVRASADCRNEKKWATKSARGSFKKCPICWWWAQKRWRTAQCLCAPAKRKNGGVKPLEEFKAQILQEIKTKAR